MLALLNHLPRTKLDVVVQLGTGCIAAIAVECASALMIAVHNRFFPFSRAACEKCMEDAWKNRKVQLTTCLKENPSSHLSFKTWKLNCPEAEALIFQDPLCEILVANAPSSFWTVLLPQVNRIANFVAYECFFVSGLLATRF